ncbi:DHH family phosphoesterase [Mycoplasmopsis canis]|uniref:DHH family phosphoesterase n=1 Tax=Mycoplasmopsis canis TaxID=29555 RepID=UPI00025AF3AD|nr:DHH family phosphoesterase [Mycoplasmopsis canis]EIE40191.1 signaling protein [Mycoplasmopsis canis UF33]
MTKNRKKWLVSISIAFGIIFIIIFIGLFIGLENDKKVSAILALGILIILLLAVLLSYYAIIEFARSRDLIKKSFNGFIEEIMTNNNIGVCIYDTKQEIVWSSSFIKSTFGKDFVGVKINNALAKINNKHQKIKDIIQTRFEFKYKENNYEVQFWPLSNLIIIRDITSESLFKIQTKEQMPVIGEIEIDNYQLYQSIFSEEQLFTISKTVIDAINEYADKYNLVYRQYTNGKFLICTNEHTIDKLISENFNLFLQIKNRIKDTSINKISISGGFAYGWTSLKKKMEQAKKALLQAQSRGGDQITIYSNIQPPIYLGSNSEILNDNNRTKIRNIASNFEKKLNDPDIKKVFIYGHKLADLDAFGSAYAVWEIAKAFDKEAYIIADTYDNTVKQLIYDNFTDKSSIIYNSNFALRNTDEKSLVVFVDIADPERTDNVNAINQVNRDNIFVFDHHRLAKSIEFAPKTNCYVETGSSSAAEIITEVISFFEHKMAISQLAAQLLLNGIYLDTSQFSKSVTPRTYDAASWLESKGANSLKSGELLKIDEQTEEKIKDMIKNIVEIKKGYFLAYSDVEATNDEISIAANEILKIKGRVASFVVAKLSSSKNTFKLSARGIETNVQIICEAVGGGGHFSTAAATSNEDLETFVNNIKHAIATTGRQIKNESNIN